MGNLVFAFPLKRRLALLINSSIHCNPPETVLDSIKLHLKFI